jgi:ABC-type transport auxiliary lipoprotein component
MPPSGYDASHSVPSAHVGPAACAPAGAADRVLLERTVAVSEPVVASSFDGFVAAMAQALERAASEIARDVGDARSRSGEGCPAR